MVRAYQRHALVLTLAFVGLAGSASATGAVPTVDLSWHDCSPVVTSVTGPVPGTYRLYVSALGQEEAHQGYVVRLHVRSADWSPVPDAWRFDHDGCQGPSRIEIRHLPPPALAKFCPAFQGTASSMQLAQYAFDPATGRAELDLGNRYPDGVPAPEPTVRSFLLGVDFHHAHSVTWTVNPGAACGGFEKDMVISFTLNLGCHRPSPSDCPPPPPPSWLDMQGEEHDFAVGNGSVTFCGSCVPVAATAATWGQIKGAYRR